MSRPRIFYGWWIVAAFFTLNAYWGATLLVGFSVFFDPIKEAFALSNTVTALAISLRMAASAVGAPAVGALLDRIGPRPLIFTATLTTGGGMILLAFAHSIWAFFLAFSIASVGFGIYVSGVGQASIAMWFVRHRVRAISLSLAGVGVGSLVVPILVWMEGEWGWRNSLVAVVVGLVSLGVPLSLLLRHRPERYGLQPDGDTSSGGESGGESEEPVNPSTTPDWDFGDVWRSRGFWLLTFGRASWGLAMGSQALFIIPHLEAQGFTKFVAGLAVTGVGAVGLVTAVGVGWLTDAVPKRQLLGFAYLIGGAGIVTLAFATSVWHLIPFVVLLGMGWRAAVPLYVSLSADYFGRLNFGKVQGLQMSVFTGALAVGPIIGAAVRDLTGSLTPVFVAFGALSVGSFAIAMLAGPPRPVERGAVVEAASPR